MTSQRKAVSSVDHAQMVRAAAHPLRARALAMMIDRPTSPKEVASAAGEPIGNVAYHVRELERAGLIELVEERKSRGAPAHFYSGTTTTKTVIDDDEWAALSAQQREIYSVAIAHLVISDLGLALDAGSLDARTDRHLSRIPLEIDEAGWVEVREIYLGALRATMLAQVRSRARIEETGRRPLVATAALLLFEMPQI